MELVIERKTCRVCGLNNLTPILSLGEQYVTNFVESPESEAFKGPLSLVLCKVSDGGCGLLQMQHTFNHDVLYKKYWYQSGISTTMVAALQDIVKKASEIVQLSKGDIVIDIGANDGTLLRQYDLSTGVQTIGFEPSNLYAMGEKGTTKIFHDYFKHDVFNKVFGDKRAKIITAISMFYDLEDPNSFVADAAKILDANGVFIIQMNYLGLMLENNTYDNISHEHLEYYSLFSLENLLKRHGLEVFDVELNDVNGGSIRTYIRHKGAKVNAFPGAELRLKQQREVEKTLGLEDQKVYDEFAKRIEATKQKLVVFLKREVAAGKKVYIYGASTRGLVVLQYAGIDNKLIKAATDKNKDKWGKYIVGTGIPIVSVEQYRKDKPDYLFVLPYHFLKEIKAQETEFMSNGGKLIVAIPEFKVIDKGE
ncbi:MAG: class I SAM-dependent methyltransferase [Candidatus Micrarchaeota archaeon]|nr:class I SAM-dependent methyltransferase [Candidatus Micrarchaeota archaeon]